MTSSLDLSKLKSSWTKYDIVQVMEVIYDIPTIEKFKNKEANIDEPTLRNFLGIKSLKEPIPEYWIEIQKFPKEKSLFALLAVIFTHNEIIHEFASKYSKGDGKGIFTVQGGKQYTNIRSALIESGAASPIYRRTVNVPFDFSPIFQNGKVGALFKEVLIERITRVSKLTKEDLTESLLYAICISNNFHKVLGLSEEQFITWLKGDLPSFGDVFINEVRIANFFSVDDAKLCFDNSKEVYFLGENGDGKSLILMAIYLSFNGNYIAEQTDQEKTGKAVDIIRNNKSIQLIGYDDKGHFYNPQKGSFLNNLFTYGTHRGRYSADKPEEYGFMSLFDSEQTLLSPVSWLVSQKFLEIENNAKGQSKKTLTVFPVPMLEKIFHDLLEKNVEVKIEATGVTFIEKGTPLTFEQLSEGYKSILIFVSDLLYRLNKNSVGGKQISDLKGTVIVDEIDLHLHPKWQRVIINKLRKLLPNIQFIFTTHSPTIIQGASEDAMIFRVYRNKEDGKTRVSDPYYRRDLDHLMINSLITSPLFGLNDSRMNPEENNSDTSETYLLYRINNKLKEVLANQKSEGKDFISDQAIDELIQQILDEEIGKND